jgi:hypothetical protein
VPRESEFMRATGCSKHCDIAHAEVNGTSLWTIKEKWKSLFSSRRKRKKGADHSTPSFLAIHGHDPGGKTERLFFLLNRKLHRSADFPMQLDGNLEFADRLDRISKRDLALLDVEALGGERLRNVGGGDRAE